MHLNVFTGNLTQYLHQFYCFPLKKVTQPREKSCTLKREKSFNPTSTRGEMTFSVLSYEAACLWEQKSSGGGGKINK